MALPCHAGSIRSPESICSDVICCPLQIMQVEPFMILVTDGCKQPSEAAPAAAPGLRPHSFAADAHETMLLLLPDGV
jgi:hypothetical protein